MSTPLPLDFQALTLAIGQKEITILQLQYQVAMLSSEVARLKQYEFDAAADARDIPSCAVTQPDQFAGD